MYIPVRKDDDRKRKFFARQTFIMFTEVYKDTCPIKNNLPVARVTDMKIFQIVLLILSIILRSFSSLRGILLNKNARIRIPPSLYRLISSNKIAPCEIFLAL